LLGRPEHVGEATDARIIAKAMEWAGEADIAGMKEGSMWLIYWAGLSMLLRKPIRAIKMK